MSQLCVMGLLEDFNLPVVGLLSFLLLEEKHSVGFIVLDLFSGD